MSKRWKVRKKNVEKRERSDKILMDFYDNVLKTLEQMRNEELKKQENEKTK